MNHPPDDPLNAAWNELANGPELDTSRSIDGTDTALLRAMHATAGMVQPDPAFRDQLWAELSQRPVIATPTPTATWSLPGSFANRSGAPTMTPRRVPTSRRWNPPIATIAAALVIALVGYGALSLSGVNPSGINLNLNEVPNASAQGRGMAQVDNAVVGTWAWLGSFGTEASSSPDIIAILTLSADGTLIFTPTWNAVGQGTWMADEAGRIQIDISWLYTTDYFEDLQQEGRDEATATTIYPALTRFRIGFTLSRDGQSWEDQTFAYEMLVRDNELTFGSGEPTLYRITDFPPEMDGMEEGFDARRLDRVIDEAPTISAADAGFGPSSPDSSPIPAITPDVNISGPSATPTTSANLTEDAELSASVEVQATATAVSNVQLSTPTLSPVTPTASP